MAYTIQALVAKAGVMTPLATAGLTLVGLDHGIEMIPLGRSLREQFNLPFLPMTDEGASNLPQTLNDLCVEMSMNGEVAYIEAEFFGGVGTQAYTLFKHGNQIQSAVSQSAINEALRFLGVDDTGDTDEFEAIGLCRYRDTDELLDQQNE